ncbi:MAG TPA: type III pantothenate kinase [Ruminococcus sp.]|nr:type III pantothenate kinase [Ruminococcus sp.]
MVLAVDIGNTNIVIGGFEKAGVVFTERLSTARLNTEAEYTYLIQSVLQMHGLSGDSFEGCIVCSVVPPVTQTIRGTVLRLLGKEPLVVGAGIKTGLKILIDNPAALGSDRVADAVAASACYPLPVITVDLGTATTVSVVDQEKHFLGGLIIPGVRVALESLSSRASQLPVISLEPAKKVIGTNTVDCMKSGIIYSTAASIDGVTARIEEELGMSCTIVATGGNAGKILPFCKREIIYDEWLLLKGLMLIYYKNQ